jgi:AcrR family transcriptional regulator
MGPPRSEVIVRWRAPRHRAAIGGSERAALPCRPVRVTLSRMPAKRTYHHGDLREAVLEAARARVLTDGTAGLSLRALARDIGVSHPAIYNHFADREALLVALSTEALLLLGESQRRARQRAASPIDALERMAVAYLRFGLAHPARLRLAFTPEFSQSSRYPAMRAAADAAEAPALAAVAGLAEVGLLAPDTVRELTVAFWSLVHGFTTLAIDGRLVEGGLSVRGQSAAALALTLRRATRRLLGPVSP